eukprot:CAMPEP_0173432438 /NCGR_PEP_ID=MMETSP1357-20121228/10235_1 /TAXON_ID=77926 /ORGANISM="Hemiselmis rufescens, Strain PCC563" /LENGTH=255 /DNA_ID=CAMNT_0014397029 /DNA_START=65 /DNA_END=829 /DNA_ORIENTATION=-
MAAGNRMAPAVTSVLVACALLLAAVALTTQGGGGEEVSPVDDRMGPVELFEKLHSAAALAAFCKHIGKVRKQAISPCGAGAAHPCCTAKQLAMEKMRAGTTANFDWSSPSSWSGQKGAAAQHIAHKAAAGGGMMQGWQTAAPQQQQAPMYQQPPPPQYAQQPQGGYPAPPQQQQYWAHLLPGQGGVPEGGAAPPQQMYQGAPPQQYAPPQQGPYPVSQNWGPSTGGAPPQYAQQAPPQQGGYAPPQQQMYSAPPP